MSNVIFIEGFEALTPSSQLTPHNLRHYMQALEPPVTDNWFADSGTATISNTKSRLVGGQSAHFYRAAGAAGQWDHRYGADMGFGFTNKQRMVVGFAVYYDTQPINAIPVVKFSNDVGAGEEEQLGLWVSPSGKLFFSSVDYATDQSSQTLPVMIPEGATPPQVFRFGKWQYIEIFVDYTQDTPTISVQVNGNPVIEQAEAAAFAKLNSKYVSSVWFINPPNVYWNNAAVNHYFDDIYMKAGASGFLGPQEIVFLGPGALVQNQWAGGGSINLGKISPGSLGTGVKPTALGQVNLYELSDLPADIAQLNGLSVFCVGSAGYDGTDELIDRVEFGVRKSAADTAKATKVSAFEGPVFGFRHTIDTNSMPGSGTPMDQANVNSLVLYLKERGFI